MKVNYQVWGPIKDQVWDEVKDQIGDQVNNQVWIQVCRNFALVCSRIRDNQIKEQIMNWIEEDIGTVSDICSFAPSDDLRREHCFEVPVPQVGSIFQVCWRCGISRVYNSPVIKW